MFSFPSPCFIAISQNDTILTLTFGSVETIRLASCESREGLHNGISKHSCPEGNSHILLKASWSLVKIRGHVKFILQATKLTKENGGLSSCLCTDEATDLLKDLVKLR